MSCAPEKTRRGFALLTVLGAVAVLSAVALALATSVRTEIRATQNRQDDLRAYYLAQAGTEEAIYLLAYRGSAEIPTARNLVAQVGGRELAFDLGEGHVRVAIRSEAGKIDLNQADEDLLARLGQTIGLNSPEARQLAQAIIHWRSPRSESTEDALDRYYRSLPEPYAARHGRFATVEELLLVRGMTRDVLYGTFELTEDGDVVRRGGLIDDVTVYNRGGLVDANSASYEVLRALDLSDWGARSILKARQVKPFATLADLQAVAPSEPAASRLTVAAGDALELTATGEPAGSAVRHTIRAVIKLNTGAAPPYQVLAWYDQSPRWNQ